VRDLCRRKRDVRPLREEILRRNRGHEGLPKEAILVGTLTPRRTSATIRVHVAWGWVRIIVPARLAGTSLADGLRPARDD
jgi:hypothetical protein